jgi:UDP-N-acetylmuramoyl-L-alanyl-D-glutamate--2,6-diaminopimelate ligase
MDRPRVTPRPLASLGFPQAPPVSICGLEIDSRRVQPQDAFVALPGHHRHGADFAADAVERGAVAIITDADGGRLLESCAVPVIVDGAPRANVGSWAADLYATNDLGLTVLGVTGTNGKTSVSYLVAAGCAAAGRNVGLVGTIEIRYGSVILPSERTTPEAVHLHQLLASMAQAGVDTVVLEVSSHAMREYRVSGLHFTAVGFTNLSQDHLDYHGTMEAYFQAKAELFTETYAERAVIVIDDEWGRRLLQECPIPSQSVSLHDPSAEWLGVPTPSGVLVRGPGNAEFAVEMALPGTFNAVNATVAVALIGQSDISIPEAIAGFADVRIPGRMEFFVADDGLEVIVDYAHTPDAISNIGNAVQSSGNVIVVLGAGGDRDAQKRLDMGSAAAAFASRVIVTDDNPRSEDPAAIRRLIVSGASSVPGVRVDDIADRRVAIAEAIRSADAGDIVLVLGKGHERGQEIAGRVLPFSDQEVVSSLLLERSAS